MKRWAVGANLIVGDTANIEHGWLVVEDGVIVSLGTDYPDDMTPTFDLGDATVIPGLIDIHIHGRDGHDVMDATPHALAAISCSLSKFGVTGFLATTVTSTWENTLLALETVGQVGAGLALPGARMLGAYSEGLFFNPLHKGAHNEQYFIEPSAERVDRLVDTAAGQLKVLALAPEIAGATEAIERATALGVRVVIGHTDATYSQSCDALDRGACGGVHVFNGMRGIHHREPGCAGAVLLRPGTVEVIADGEHLHPGIIDLIVRLKAPEEILLISDCMCAGGAGDGIYRLGEADVVVEQGVARTNSGGLAGSTLTLDRAVRIMAAAASIDFREAVHMASLNPARFLGLDSEIGSLASGKRCDLAIIGPDDEVIATLCAGSPVYVSDMAKAFGRFVTEQS